MNQSALLVLEDGSVFHGTAIGQSGTTVGEVVFNTSMTGYQEILTDPSYAKQIVTLTYPHIGNVGTNDEDVEAERSWVAGLVIRDYPLLHSNWRAQLSLHDYLVKQNITAIADIDTRRLTQLLRDKGAMKGCISTEISDVNAAVARMNEFAGLEGLDLAKEVTSSEPYQWTQPTWGNDVPSDKPYHVVVYDFGVKFNILRLLVDRGCQVTVVPATTPASDVIALNPDGVLLSNGPGDPAACTYAVDAILDLQEQKIPLFGICLGFQLLAIANGASTHKMKFGHHGANHPITRLQNQQVYITSQNHGFAVDESSLSGSIEVTHRSLFDDTLQGIKIKGLPAFGLQGHPEASPGPHDVDHLFDEFIAIMKAE